jgi:hypothetical protein
MMDFPVTLVIPDLNPQNNTLRGIYDNLIAEMSGTVESGLMDASLDTDPASASGPAPKFDGSSWHSWEIDNHTFTPVNTQVHNVLLQSSPTAHRRQILNDKDGTIALLDDAYGKRPTVILPEGLVSVDWDSGDDFLCVLSGNRKSAFYMFHSKPGMEIDILLINNGTNQLTETWDPLIHWPSSISPIVPAAKAGTSAMLKVNLVNLDGTIYGEFWVYSASAPWSYDAAQPLFIS